MPDYTTAEARTAAITILLGAAETSGEINALTRVALRSDYLWRCPACRTDNYPDRISCGCGTARPAGSA